MPVKSCIRAMASCFLGVGGGEEQVPALLRRPE